MKMIIYFISMVIFSGCAYNKMDLTDNGPIATYSGDVKPILITNCYKCHTDTSTHPDRNPDVFLNDFSVLKSLALTPSSVNASFTILQARLRHIETPGMPFDKASPLPDSTIRKVENWIQQGAPNN
jgi:hypothetical protein